MHRRAFLASLGVKLAAAVTLSGCTFASAPAEAAPSLEGTSWSLAELDGRAPLAGSHVTLRFDGGRVSGSDGCNQYSGSYTVSGSSLRVDSKLASTMMACPAVIMEQASNYVHALMEARSFRMEAGGLLLMGERGKLLARLAARGRESAPKQAPP